MRHLSLAPTTVPAAAPLDFIGWAVESGCDSIGLRLHRSPSLPFHPVVGDARLAAEMRARLGGLPVLDVFTFYLEPESDFDAFERALALGAEFGARYALVQGNDPELDRVMRTFARFDALADRYGMGAVIEFNPARPLATLDQALALLAKAGGPRSGVCVDPLHLVRSGGTPADTARIERRYLPYAQFSDGTPAPVARRLAGEGTLPLREILAALPPELPLSVEVPIPPGETDGVRWCRRVIDSTTSWLTRV